MNTSPKFHLQNLRRHVENAGPVGVFEWVYKLYSRHRPGKDGMPIYDREWDILVVLDACRVDGFRHGIQKSEIEGELETIWSVASSSGGWMINNFSDKFQEEISKTTYICGNPHSKELLKGVEIGHLDEVWRYAWDEQQETVPAQPVTDRAITEWRSCSNEHLIVHYMQPHFPCVQNDETRYGFAPKTGLTKSIWNELKRGLLSKDYAWKLYLTNIQYVFDNLELLLQSIDADNVVVTADHGNAFGERFIWGHPEGMSMRCLREVPWFKTSATDETGYLPDKYEITEENKVAVSKRLKALGYVDENYN